MYKDEKDSIIDKSRKVLFLWPKSEPITHINYHYTKFGEVIDYIKDNVTSDIIIKDLDVENFNLEKLLLKESIDKIVMHVNYENAKNSFAMVDKIKEIKSYKVLGSQFYFR